jgi:hypothetical protein
MPLWERGRLRWIPMLEDSGSPQGNGEDWGSTRLPWRPCGAVIAGQKRRGGMDAWGWALRQFVLVTQSELGAGGV